MPYLVRDREAKQGRAVRALVPRQPLHTVDEDRCQLALVRLRVYQGVSELEVSLRRWGGRKPREPHGKVCGAQRRVADRCHRLIAAGQPCHIDAGGGQDPGRRTQSNRLIRRRHHSEVVHAHGQARTGNVRFLRNCRSVLRCSLRHTWGRHHGRENQCEGDGVRHDATVRRAGECLNALEVT